MTENILKALSDIELQREHHCLKEIITRYPDSMIGVEAVSKLEMVRKEMGRRVALEFMRQSINN